MPNSPSPPISPFCAAPRIPAISSSRRQTWAMPPSASPTATPWPAWCAPMRHGRNWSLTARPRLLIGARLVFRDGTPDILAYPKDRKAYARLCRLISIWQAARGERRMSAGFLQTCCEYRRGLLLIVMPPADLQAAEAGSGSTGARYLAGGVHALYRRGSPPAARPEAAGAQARGIPLIAVNDALYHASGPARSAGCRHLHPRACDA